MSEFGSPIFIYRDRGNKLIVTDYLECSAKEHPNKAAFVDENKSLDFSELRSLSLKIASGICALGVFKSPVAVYLDKSAQCIAAFMGALYSGNFYSSLDTAMPQTRIEKIISTLRPAVIVTDEAHKDAAEGFAKGASIVTLEDSFSRKADEAAVLEVTSKVLDTDICYILFTSGSTGNPKGVIIPHRAVVDFTEWGAKCLGIDSSYVFGNQTPFYFSMSVFDIYQTLRNGATTYIVPHRFFMFPAQLMDYLDKNRINTLFWVPSALSIISALGALASPHLTALRNVFFGGEVMPMKQLNKWRAEYPDARYINFYGPTEVTDTCTIYEVSREFSDKETLPMGFACENMDVFLLSEDDRLVTDGIGEVCVRGTGLAYGYYNDPEKTAAVFVQNPLNKAYPELIYRTGDLARYNEYGELVYMGRKDFQIKHMGHRIELGEIEAAVLSLDEVKEACCLYDSKKSRIVMFYTGDTEDEALMEKLKGLLPSYMLPNRREKLEEMPKNLNGKIDRAKLKDSL